MQPSVSVAQQLPTASTSAVVGGKLPSAPTGFGNALEKLLAAVADANQPAAPTDVATVIAQATDVPPASVPAPEPGQTPSEPPVASVPPPADTAIRAPSDTSQCKARPETQPVRRGKRPGAAMVAVLVDQPALPTVVQPLPVATPLPDGAPEHGSLAEPRQRAEAPEPKEVGKAGPSPQTVEASAARTSVAVDAMTSPPSQALQGAVPGQSAALPAVELAARVPPATPEAVAQSTPSILGTAASASPSHAASPARAARTGARADGPWAGRRAAADRAARSARTRSRAGAHRPPSRRRGACRDNS